ncbi:MAG: 2-dehydropantoate 2-reductase [Chloroflexi bacterium]|nr:2-dehydropantoate 2-reductase [Chloroflexota bacterium]
MRILIMGSGGIGGYYGARLLKAGNEVVFVARGAHLEAMQARGLETREVGGGDVMVQPVQAVRYPADAGGTFDFILFAVKTYDNDEAAAAVAPVVGTETSVLPVQNGIDSVEMVGRHVPREAILAGSTDMSAKILEPGIIQRLSQGSRITVGEAAAPRTPRVERIVAAFHEAGIPDAVITDDSQRALWEKFMFLAPVASVNSCTGLPTGRIKAAEGGIELLAALRDEIRAVGLATGVNLPDEAVERVAGIHGRLTDAHTVSMQRDFEAGRRVELETLTGTVVRRGRAVGVSTPLFSALYAILRAKAESMGIVK